MRAIHRNEAGLVVACLLGGWHLLWALLVATHWAQPLIDFVFWIHFIKPVYVVEDFNIGRAVALVAVTASIGYVVGFCFAVLWNRIHK